VTQIKLPRLPDRNPVKLTIQLSPQLLAHLNSYAALYVEAYGQEESLSDLIPAMLAAFLETDRAFAKARAQTK